MRHLHEGMEGVTSLLRHFSGRQTSAGRERNSDIQHSISHSQSNTTQFQVTIERNTMCVCVSSLAFNTVHSLVVCVQESLVSTTDALLTATLQPLLTSLSSQLALHSALLSQSTASLRAQVGNREIIMRLVCLLSYDLFFHSCNVMLNMCPSLCLTSIGR